MSSVHFRFSPNILVRLGEELNQGADQSLLELIKNSYDADATVCSVELINTSSSGGTVIVTDDGAGMSVDSIKDSWLVLGKSSKNSHQTTRLGRTPSGSKGLGRLAALRMGRSVRLQSTQLGEYSSVLEVDWDKFDTAETVEDVSLSIERAKLGAPNGTKTELRNLRTPIRSDDLKKLARIVLMLTDPFGDDVSGFKVELQAPEFKEVEKLLKSKYFDSAEYHLSAGIDIDGRAWAEVLDWKGAVLHSGGHDDVRNIKSSSLYKAPECKFDLWAFLLKKESFASGRTSNMSDVKDWLRQFGGVHVYQDKVRVSPYGGAGDDWLGINLIRTQNPEERPSTNTSIGRISLSNKGKYALTQKTDRSGYIADEHFNELKAFAVESLEWMARWRLQQAERRRQSERMEVPSAAVKEKATVNELILEVPERIRSKISAAFDKYAKSRDREADNLKKEIQLYRTLSTAGITAATFAHEAHGNPLKAIELATTAIELRLNAYAPEDKKPTVMRLVAKIRKALDALMTLSSATLSLVKLSKRRVGKVEINSVIVQIEGMMRPFYEARDTSLLLDLSPGNPFMRCSEAALESIFTNLLNNALNAFRRSGVNERNILISTEVSGLDCIVRVADSGLGITQQNVSDIWLPGVTSDPDGTGLGLTIVKDTVKDLNGSIEVVPNGALGGAEFIMKLPVVG
ncbi:sensor histidine kinase [Pseudomonas corrugata]|uniref:sensor histidine kinase n=1 Tax=Pseudomonas corrugata TaxID=47879 RepID=UPI0028C4710E|nr:sensor histidine kinase [Pseudomonas corrugata]MDU9025318.1 sensor histidine kinase [Pseudomonas corrugata]